METTNKTTIRIETSINAPKNKVWEFWTGPAHIIKWNNASDDWHTPHAENDLRTGGKFTSTMAAKDGSASFDFEGTYTKVEEQKLIEYTITDDRKVKVSFTSEDNATKLVEMFEAENINSIEMQQGGWQSILDNFKKYAEENL